MLSLIFCLVVVSWLLPGILAPQTSGGDYSPSTVAWTPRPTPSVKNVHRRDVSLGTSLSTSIPPVPTSAMANHALSHGAIAGIVVSIISFIIFAAFFLAAANFWTELRLQPLRHQKQQISPKPTPEAKVIMSQKQITSSVATFFALPNGRPWSDAVLPPFKDDSIEYKFMALLALFGSNGVPLRDFIMLASLRTSTKTSHNHWLVDGERGPLRDSIDAETTYGECSYLAAFTHEASTIQSVEVFQKRLVSLGLINIEYQDLSETHSSAQKCWFMDGRIWRINQRLLYSDYFRHRLLREVFVEVFAEIPCKDISPLAERQREIYYYHGHQAMVYLFTNSPLRAEHLKHFVLVILQVLSHRFQKHDEAFLSLAKTHFPSSGLHPDWNLILLVAELKATISTNGLEVHSRIKNEIFQAVENSYTRSDSSPRARGLSGWLLVELLDTAEVQGYTKVADDTMRKGKQWMQRLLGSKLSSLEQIMLCRAIARFGTSDDPEPQHRQYDLLFGYHLSRAGCIEKAEKLLLSGLEYYASSPMSTRLWSYRFELVSLILRAGRWSEAEAWLSSARNSAVSRSRVIHVPEFWKRSGECGEIFILLGLYQADCDMAMGRLTSAEDCLKDTIETTLFVRDYYIRALRLALRTRLMKVQMWQELWERATVTAQDLIEDTIDSGDCLSTARSSSSVGVIVLTLINKLLWVGDVAGAARLLMSAKRFEDAECRVLPLDIELYLERRRAAVSHLLSVEGSPQYIQHLEDSGADAEDAITVAPVLDQPSRNPDAKPSRAQGPTSENSDGKATKAMPSHSGPNPVKHSSAYKWSSELEHAKFPTPEVEQLDDLEIRSHEAKVLDAKDTVRPQTAKHGAKRVRILRLGTKRGAVHSGNPLAKKLDQAPRPPTHEPGKPKSPTYNYPAEVEPNFRLMQQQPVPA